MAASKPAGPTFNASAWGIRELVASFFIWKIILLLVACASPGPGYDTSTQILLDQYQRPSASLVARVVEHVVLRLTRWDAIYFATSSANGHVHEQAWAFSWVLSRITSAVSRVFPWPVELSSVVKNALIGILISHASHLLAVILLYYLVFSIVPSKNKTAGLSTSDGQRRPIAFQAALLHILSPAGLFLSAPYGESTFALFNFLGMLCYAWAVQYRQDGNAISRDAMFTVLAGASFGLASMMRSNGLLSGTIFAWDAAIFVIQLPSSVKAKKKQATFAATIVAGLLVAMGFAFPQAVAYREYCTNGNTRPWCDKIPPSIYSWVQSHYWGVGFLKYWTLNNLPLFLLATPMLVVMMYTGFVGLTGTYDGVVVPPGKNEDAATQRRVFRHVLRQLALPQLILACMAATSFHVQIINRISSGYPVWYIFLVIAINDASGRQGRAKNPVARSSKLRGGDLMRVDEKYVRGAVRAMVIYAIVQAGLYASFMPPA